MFKNQAFFHPFKSLFVALKRAFWGKHFLAVGGFFILTLPPALANTEDFLSPQLFPRSAIIDVQVFFWKKVFTEVTTQEVVIHDRSLILPIYEKVSVRGLTRKQAKKKLNLRKHHIQNQLKVLADHLEKNRPLSPAQKTLLKKFYSGITPKGLRTAAQRLRNQYGISDRFREGLRRSGAYMNFIHAVLREHNLPRELAYLPHVESSFNHKARSKSGAKGVWQFTRSTGKIFMQVNSKVDERIDPFISTVAAAKLLSSNYRKLQSWPLAITAYNHGAGGIGRISKKLKTKDLGKMIQYYHSRRFSFASKNFYAEFLAAAEVAGNYEKYFGPIRFQVPIRYKEIQLPWSMPLYRITSELGLSRNQILSLNPALQASVVKGKRHVPTYYRLKVPFTNSMQVARWENSLKNAQSSWVTVRNGDTLSEIAERYGMSLGQLVSLNNISKRSTIHPGQTLRVSAPQRVARHSKKSKRYAGQAVRVSAPRTSYVVVRRGDSLTTIARKHGIPLYRLMASNGLNSRSIIYPGQRLRLQNGSNASDYQRVHRVRRGETLGAIARRVGIRLDELTSMNGLSRSSTIYPGQRLIISL